jgi:hypothetical protein
MRLNITQCKLRQSVLEIAQALPASLTLKRLYLAQNELYYGQRRLALQLGANIAKCSNLSRVDLSQNAITTEMAISFLRGLGDMSHLHQLDLSRNEIGETAGRAISTFIVKAATLRKLDISQNPLLKVTLNKRLGQERLEAESQKPGGGNKTEKPKVYVPGCYLIAVALGKSASMKEIKMHGLVVNQAEWLQKLAPLGEKVRVLWRAVDAESFNFPRPPPPPAAAPKPPPAKGGKTPAKSGIAKKK